jgi:hypothetical protein
MSIDRRRMVALSGAATVETVTHLVTAAPVDRAALATYAASLFALIHAARALGRPRDSAFFILEHGSAYVQALAVRDGSLIRVEAASDKLIPAMAEVLSPTKRGRLIQLGFQPPDASPNHWQDLDIVGSADLRSAGTLAATVLTEVFGVSDADAVSALVNIPGVRQLRRLGGRALHDLTATRPPAA